MGADQEGGDPCRQSKLFFAQPIEKKMLVDMHNVASFKGYLRALPPPSILPKHFLGGRC